MNRIFFCVPALFALAVADSVPIVTYVHPVRQTDFFAYPQGCAWRWYYQPDFADYSEWMWTWDSERGAYYSRTMWIDTVHLPPSGAQWTWTTDCTCGPGWPVQSPRVLQGVLVESGAGWELHFAWPEPDREYLPLRVYSHNWWGGQVIALQIRSLDPAGVTRYIRDVTVDRNTDMTLLVPVWCGGQLQYRDGCWDEAYSSVVYGDWYSLTRGVEGYSKMYFYGCGDVEGFMVPDKIALRSLPGKLDELIAAVGSSTGSGGGGGGTGAWDDAVSDYRTNQTDALRAEAASGALQTAQQWTNTVPGSTIQVPGQVPVDRWVVPLPKGQVLDLNPFATAFYTSLRPALVYLYWAVALVVWGWWAQSEVKDAMGIIMTSPTAQGTTIIPGIGHGTLLAAITAVVVVLLSVQAAAVQWVLSGGGLFAGMSLADVSVGMPGAAWVWDALCELVPLRQLIAIVVSTMAGRWWIQGLTMWLCGLRFAVGLS